MPKNPDGSGVASGSTTVVGVGVGGSGMGVGGSGVAVGVGEGVAVGLGVGEGVGVGVGVGVGRLLKIRSRFRSDPPLANSTTVEAATPSRKNSMSKPMRPGSLGSTTRFLNSSPTISDGKDS